jgi:tRNA threonylcarbamoyladenosine biosynthesis protein TsaB
VGLLDETHGCWYTRVLSSPPSSSQVLAGCVCELAASWGRPVHALTYLVVGLGPGSFTGLRVGLAFMKGLARAIAAPLVGVSTVAALACSYDGPHTLVCPVIDARKGEVYGALFRRNAGTAQPTTLIAERACAPAHLMELVEHAAGAEAVAFVGPGLDALGLDAREPNLLAHSRRALAAPQAAALAFLAGEMRTHGRPPCSLADVAPTYLRASDAEIARAARDTTMRRNA